MLAICLLMMTMTALQSEELIKLPPPRQHSEVALEEALAKRRSIRAFRPEKLTMEQVGQLLWAAQGITAPSEGLRTAPSAGALYPLEMYVVLPTGVYHYEPGGHQMRRINAADLRSELSRAALSQESVQEAPATFVIAGVETRTTQKYRERGRRYVDMEVGHAAQNLLLQAAALGLGGVPVGAYDDAQVEKVLQLPVEQKALYLIPVGKPAR